MKKVYHMQNSVSLHVYPWGYGRRYEFPRRSPPYRRPNRKKEMLSTTILLHRINREKNELRFYWLSVGSSLVDELAVLRQWGRIGGHQRGMVTPCVSVGEAKKLTRRLIRRRLRGGYEVVGGSIDDFIQEAE